MSRRLLTLLAVVLLAAAAAAAYRWWARPAPTAAEAAGAESTAPVETAQGLALQTVTLEQRRQSSPPVDGENVHVRLRYPKTGQAALDELISLWIGTQCPTANPEGKPGTPQDCVARLLEECLAPPSPEEPPVATPIRCVYDATMTAELNAHGLLTLSYRANEDHGGAHGLPTVAYLNIDVERGDPLRLQNLVRMRPAKLEALLESTLRERRGIAADLPLKEAGFLVDTIPVPESVLVEAGGLRFTWQVYDIAPYSDGQPSVLIPYEALAAAVPTNSPLRRLPALGARD